LNILSYTKHEFGFEMLLTTYRVKLPSADILHCVWFKHWVTRYCLNFRDGSVFCKLKRDLHNSFNSRLSSQRWICRQFCLVQVRRWLSLRPGHTHEDEETEEHHLSGSHWTNLAQFGGALHDQLLLTGDYAQNPDCESLSPTIDYTEACPGVSTARGERLHVLEFLQISQGLDLN
jgi:hypothetical protein